MTVLLQIDEIPSGYSPTIQPRALPGLSAVGSPIPATYSSYVYPFDVSALVDADYEVELIGVSVPTQRFYVRKTSTTAFLIDSPDEPLAITTNLLQAGSAWLNDQMRNHASTMVTYKRGSSQIPILAEFGKTRFNVSDSNGVLSDIFSSDFMFDVSEFRLHGQRITPERFDEIIVGSKVYEVYPFDRDQAYRYCDPFEHRIRVHTRERVG